MLDIVVSVNNIEKPVCLLRWTGELYPELLAFHHLDPSNKLANVANLYHKGRELTMREIDKCIVVCWNCHILIHRELT